MYIISCENENFNNSTISEIDYVNKFNKLI